jgi:hypothetical protein
MMLTDITHADKGLFGLLLITDTPEKPLKPIILDDG